MEISAIQMAMQSAEKQELGNVSGLQGPIITATNEIEHLEELQGNLFGVEKTSGKAISLRLNRARDTLTKLERKKELMVLVNNLKKAYLRFSMEPLTWRSGGGASQISCVYLVQSGGFICDSSWSRLDGA